MALRLSADEIIDSAADGEPVYWSATETDRVLREHGFGLDDYTQEVEAWHRRYSAANVLLWLGY